MPAWAILAVKIAVAFAVVVFVVGGGIYMAFTAREKSDVSAQKLVEREKFGAQNRRQIERNTERLTGLLGCLQRSRDPQGCLDRVAGPRGPGGTSESTGRMGARGARGTAGRSIIGARGPRGGRGLRGRPGRDGRPGKDGLDAQQPANGVDGIDGVDGTPGLRGPPGPPPTDEQIQAAVNNYCMSHNNCAPAQPVPDSPPVVP